MSRSDSCVLAMAVVVSVFATVVRGQQVNWEDTVQAHYLWINDDGSEALATEKYAVDTANTTQFREENIRLRFGLENTLRNATPTNGHLRLEYSVQQTVGFVAVPVVETTAPFVMTTTDHYTNFTPTTQRFAGPGPKFSAGQCIEYPTNTTQSVDIGSAKGSWTEVEYCFQATTNAVLGKTYYFRVGNEPLREYLVLATMTMMGPLEITNTAASVISTTSATIGGETGYTGGADPTVSIYWGSVSNQLTNVINFGQQPGMFSTNLTGLLANETYFYTCYATNVFDEAWAETTNNFTTLSPGLTFTGTPYQVIEDQTNITISLRLETTSAVPVSVIYATTAGTAVVDDDYTHVTNTLTWNAGEVGTKTFTVPIVDDGDPEGSESFSVGLSSFTACTAGVTTVSVEIIDDDGEPTLGFVEIESSGAEETTPVNLLVRLLGGDGGGAVTGQYSVSVGSTASQGSDYTLPTNVVVFPPGHTETNIVLNIIDDSIFEEDETVIVTFLSVSGAQFGVRTNHTYTIVDSDVKAPSVDNWYGAIQIHSNSATLRGQITDTGRQDPEVIIYFGTTDGGTDPAAWQTNVSLGTRGVGIFSGSTTNALASLQAGAFYYYRCYATNDGGGAWATISDTFYAIDPPSVGICTNASFEAPVGMADPDADHWSRSDTSKVSRVDQIPRTDTYAMEFTGANASVFGINDNVLRLSWNGLTESSDVHVLGGIRPGYLMRGAAYVRRTANPDQDDDFTYKWWNKTDGYAWMTDSLTIDQVDYQTISISNATPLQVSDVGDSFYPILSTGSSSDSYHADDLTIETYLPRLELSPAPTNVSFGFVGSGGHKDLVFKARNYQSTDGTVLYGALITDSDDLTNSAWDATAWAINIDADGVFEVFSGSSLVATSGLSGWQSCTVRFAPTQLGSYTGALRVATTDPIDRYPTNAWYSGGGRLFGGPGNQGGIVFEDYEIVGHCVNVATMFGHR